MTRFRHPTTTPLSHSSALQWQLLTSLERKPELYGADPYFREAVWDAAGVLGDRFYPMLHSTAFLVIKPEALAARRLRAILNYVEANRFEPFCYRIFRFSRHVVRELWRYQWNAATIEKMDLADRTLSGFQTGILLGLREEQWPREVPAAVRLQSLKGAAAPDKRDPSSIRAVLQAPNRMISFVHAPDEPADLLRDLGVFLDRSERVQFLKALSREMPTGLCFAGRRDLERIEEAMAPADFDASAAFMRIVDGAGGLRDELAKCQRYFAETGRIDWWRFIDLARQADAEEWDVLAVCAAALDHETIGYRPILKFDAAALARWLDGPAPLSL
jgi:hypothetical protein